MATTSPSLTQAAEFLRWINLIYSTVFTVWIRLGPDPIRVWVVERDLDCPSQNGSLTSIAAPSSLFVPGQTEAYSEYSCLSTAVPPDPVSAIYRSIDNAHLNKIMANSSREHSA